MTGNQLAEAMGVSFTELGNRLQKMPFRMTGESGIRSMIAALIDKNTKDTKEVEKELGWASSWLLKAAADDKQGMAAPPNVDMEAIKKSMAEQQKEL